MLQMRALGAIVALGVLAGCVGNRVESLQDVQPSGSAFTNALFEEYKALAEFEANKMYDWVDADHFAQKALLAADGEVVQPEELANWNLPEDKIGELTEGRAELVQALDGGARQRVPTEAAIAQARFDCWVEQQEENHQPDHIAACRDQFWAALEALREPAVTPVSPGAPANYIVLFAFDSAEVSDNGRSIIEAAISEANRMNADISVTGHADRAGSAEYNLGLSLRRADSVRDVMTSMGVAESRITVAGRGESEPAVPTADGVREQANRRVVIVLQ
jgi:OOP family OmpA-OmpF porin